MKTLLLTIEYPPAKGGVANYYYNLAKNWPEVDGLVVLFKKYFPNPFQYFLYFQDLYQSVKKEKIDYILVGQILPLGTVTYLFSLIFSKPYAVFLHGMDLPLALASGRKRFLTKRILGRAKKIVCANSYVAKLVQDFSPTLSLKVMVANPGAGEALPINSERVRELKEKYALTDKKVMITIGRLVKRKGVDTVLNILANKKNTEWCYVVLGGGPDEVYLKNICRERGLEDLVIFGGEINEVDKWAWLQLCDLFVMPTRNISGDFEGFGIVYLEANLAGKAVLATNSGGVSDAVLNNVNGLLVRADELDSALERLMNDAELREKLGEKGMLRAQTDFNWGVIVKKLYSEINF